ncbi:PREDICTED: BTB/POZ domain-containing protein At1g04390 [Camelina sativa]|uniref:BTB/POZ domain-containing protein At1g04390 n=1 Tax=Camelina sativa TaxID=90675 RepID=A0ABM0WRF0_CAMSA|nr:PREDICTED: BTB/POZ domain-containing protein At1g04390 [Camelina sativa]
MASSKGGNSTGHINTLHQRLYHALNLGFRVCDEKGKKWKCTDIEIQRHVVKSISAFLDCFSRATSNNRLKESISDIAGALVFILGCKNRAVVGLAANVVIRLIRIVPPSILQSYSLDLVESLSPLLRCQQLEVCLPCAVALNAILINLRETKEKEVWKIFEGAETVVSVVANLQNFSEGSMSVEWFQEMASLLSTIMLKWPQSRYSVWHNPALMSVLESVSQKPDLGLRVATLKLYSSLALCGHGANELIDNGKPMLDLMISCMEESSPQNARIEGFKLAQRLATGNQECLKMIDICSESLVKATVQTMGKWSLSSGKLSYDQKSLLVEACKLALITRWEGKHHFYFWKYRISEALLSLVVENFRSQSLDGSVSLEEEISLAEKVLNAKFLPSLRSYVWDIIGFLAAHCQEEFDSILHEDELCLNFLITCACLTLSRSVQKGYQICQTDIISASHSESASRAVLMMINSPSKYISSRARVTLSFILEEGGKENLNYLMKFMGYIPSSGGYILPNILQTTVCLVGYACYSSIPQYASFILRNQGLEILLSFCSWYQRNWENVGASSFAPSPQSTSEKRICCWVCTEDWENKDAFLLYALLALTELVNHSFSGQYHAEDLSMKSENLKDRLCTTLKEIRDGDYGSGPKWYAAHILSYLGYFGFQHNLGKRLMGAYEDEECSDMRLLFASGNSVSVHKVIIAVRCPMLLPPKERAHNGSTILTEKSQRTVQEIRMSVNVDTLALVKLLEFAYSGYVEVESTLLKKLKTLVRHCKAKVLLQMLCRRRPKWGSLIPGIDITLALAPKLIHFSDVILVPKETNVAGFNCRMCSSTSPHAHSHRVILSSGCEYLRALFRSGMQESHTDRLNVPVSWLGLTKLVSWFYSDELPNPPSGCKWNNMDNEAKLDELQAYVEIYSLSEWWIMEDLQNDCAHVILSCLESARELSIKTIELAASFSMWKLVEAAANHAAPIYHQLRDSGELDELDDELVNLIRTAAVQFSQQGS